MKKLLIATVMSVAATGPAWAEPGFYLGIEGGFTFFEDTTDEGAAYYINELGASTVEVEEDSAAFPIRPFAGFELNENIALELGVSFFSREITAEGTAGASTFKDTYEQSWRIVDFSVLLRPRASGFFARAGGHATTFDVDYKRVGTGSVADDASSNSESKSGLLLGLGYDWKIGPGALRASFTHYTNMPGYEDEYLNLLKVGYLFKF
jgi:hypothetical protein